MAYPPSAISANKTDSTPESGDHPAHHNALANAVNDIVTEVTSVGSTSAAISTKLRAQVFDVTDYGVVAGASYSANTAALATLVAALPALGATILFPPSGTFYAGKLSLTGNKRYHVVGYGAVLYGNPADIVIDINTQLGGSSLGTTIEGLHVKSPNTTDTTGVRIKDSTNVLLRDMYIEQTQRGVVLLNDVAGVDGCETNTLQNVRIQTCVVGVDFTKTNGSSSPYQMHTFMRDVLVNNCTTAGVRINTGLILARSNLNYMAWVGGTASGCVLDTDADMAGITGVIGGEQYNGASGGIAIQTHANSINWEQADLTVITGPSLNPKVNVNASITGGTDMASGAVVIYNDGQTTVSQSRGGSTVLNYGPSVRASLQTYPTVGMARDGGVLPGGTFGGVFFGTGLAAYDTFIRRTANTSGTGRVLALEAATALATGANTTANRPTNGLIAGAQFYDTTLGKPIWYTGSVWKDAAGTTV